MNKFIFVLKHNDAITESVIANSKKFLNYRDYKKKFVFSSYVDEMFVDNERDSDSYEGLRRCSRSPGRIVKSDIQEFVIKQLKDMFAEIKNSGEEVLYVVMNKHTKSFFRMYYSYEVDHIPKTLNDQNEAGKIAGSIMGVKIIIDDILQDYIVLPLVKNNLVKKFSKIFD